MWWIPVTVALLAGGALAAKRGNKVSGMTPERKLIFEQALTNEKITPADLVKLADGYAKDGMKKEADLLRKRAKLKEMPPDQKAARRQVFDKTMSLKDPTTVLQMADAFEKEGAIGAAKSLREYADGLKTIKAA